MRTDHPELSIQGLSVGPSRAVAYRVPAYWTDEGRTAPRRRERPLPLDPEQKAARNRARVIARYWQAIGYLWMRSRRITQELQNGRTMKYRQGFLTLTIPGVSTGDHKAIKRKVLDPFFTYCRNVLGLRDYVWTAEIQPGTGEIHFHAIINHFVDKDKIRRAWNDACERSGIITMASGAKPSTEIKACRSYHGSKVYAAKYLSKGLRSGEIVGRIWSGSHSVTGMGNITTNEIDGTFNLDAVVEELNTNGHVWQGFDHDVRITRLETQKITRRRYPILHRLLTNNIKANDQARATPIQRPSAMVQGTTAATERRLGSHSALSHQAVGGDMVRDWGGVSAVREILLQAEGMGVEPGPVGAEPSHVPRYVSRGGGSCPF